MWLEPKRAFFRGLHRQLSAFGPVPLSVLRAAATRKEAAPTPFFPAIRFEILFLHCGLADDPAINPECCKDAVHTCDRDEYRRAFIPVSFRMEPQILLLRLLGAAFKIAVQVRKSVVRID